VKTLLSALLALFLSLLGHDALAQISDINSAINKAGRQRMLSQRMAKYYQAASWGIADSSACANLGKARKDFTAALQELSGAPANTALINDSLA
jgi:nitrate/nitrite-specific signal transduction histidine kinase